MRYLVGYVADGPGRSAVALAGMLATADERVEIVLCHVLPEKSELPARGAPATGYQQILAQQAEQWLAEAREQLSGPEVETLVRTAPSPAAGLAGTVDEVGAQMLVVGSARHGLLRRLAEPARVFLGPTATAILRSAPVAVVAIPRGVDVSLETTTEMPVLAGGERDRSDPGRTTGESR